MNPAARYETTIVRRKSSNTVPKPEKIRDKMKVATQIPLGRLGSAKKKQKKKKNVVSVSQKKKSKPAAEGARPKRKKSKLPSR